jgi:hypothetical protein
MTKNSIVLAIALLAGCAGSRFHTSQMEQNGAIKFEIADSSEYDYKVMITNVYDFGMDLNNREEREKQIQNIFEDECKKIDFVNESKMSRGKWPFPERDKIVYVMKIKCMR